MLHTLPDAEQTALQNCTSENPLENLSETAIRLYQGLRETGRRVGEARGYVKTVSQVHFFCPGEIVAKACLMATSTMYLKLKELEALELVEARAHYVTHNGRTRSDGTVWCVKMTPEQPGRVRVPYDALKASYRCLSADIENGRTAYAEIGESKDNPLESVDIEMILSWALPPSTTQNPVTGLTLRFDLEAVLDVPHVDKVDRGAVVDGAARALAANLGDTGSLMFYRWLLWQLLRLEAAGQAAPWHMVYEQARRARVDAAEGFARKPGALFVSRLKGSPWWDEVARASGRVGSKPN
jgi:hypothetical protein